MYIERKALLILIFCFLIPDALGFPGSRSEELYARKILPASAYIALKKVYREGDAGIRYRVLLEFRSNIATSNAEWENLRNSLCFKNFCIADMAVRDIFHWAGNKTIRQVYVLNQAKPIDISKTGSEQTIIGIIDRGCDWENKCFMKGDGKESRIIYLWDQDTKESQPGNGDIPYGVEYRKHDIQASLNSQCNLIPLETGHGRIIAAIAAGNVTIRDEQDYELFPGIFPELPVIMVNTTGKMDALVDAVAYITRRAAQMKSRCVINFAYCKHIGPHDPGDIYLRAIDALLDENSLLVVAAGNEGMTNIYTRKEMLADTRLEFEINKTRYAADKTGSPCRVEIEVWYGGSPLDRISLISPTGKVYGAVGEGEYSGFDTPDGIIIANGSSNSAGLKPNVVFISIASGSGQVPTDGQWALLLEKTGKPHNKIIEAWITKSEQCDTRFKNQEQSMNTISFLAYSQKAFSVGAWQHCGDNMIEEAEFSNNPCKTVNCPSPIPNVLAAGRVTVAIPGFSEPLSQDGSSVSTALITRFIACTWNDNPGLKAADIKKKLEGKVMTFGAGPYRWNGLPIYRLAGTGNFTGPDIPSKRKMNR